MLENQASNNCRLILNTRNGRFMKKLLILSGLLLLSSHRSFAAEKWHWSKVNCMVAKDSVLEPIVSPSSFSEYNVICNNPEVKTIAVTNMLPEVNAILADSYKKRKLFDAVIALGGIEAEQVFGSDGPSAIRTTAVQINQYLLAQYTDLQNVDPVKFEALTPKLLQDIDEDWLHVRFCAIDSTDPNESSQLFQLHRKFSISRVDQNGNFISGKPITAVDTLRTSSLKNGKNRVLGYAASDDYDVIREKDFNQFEHFTYRKGNKYTIGNDQKVRIQIVEKSETTEIFLPKVKGAGYLLINGKQKIKLICETNVHRWSPPIPGHNPDSHHYNPSSNCGCRDKNDNCDSQPSDLPGGG